MKEPLLSLIKQGRAFGVSVFLSTQNPYDVDYRALSNARLWVVGRLQTSNDRRRVLEGIGEVSSRTNLGSLEEALASLKPREFAVYNAGSGSLDIVRTRDAHSTLLGPLTLDQVSARAKPPPAQAQAKPSPEAGLLLLPPAVEGVEEYFLRSRSLGEVAAHKGLLRPSASRAVVRSRDLRAQEAPALPSVQGRETGGRHPTARARHERVETRGFRDRGAGDTTRAAGPG